MTPIGTGCLIVMMIMAMAALLYCAVTPREQKDAGRRGRRPLRSEAPRMLPEIPGEPVLFRTAEARFINCKAQTTVDPGTVEIYGERAARLEREYLAYNLADQLLAAGGIAFRKDGNILRAELRAVIPE